MEKIRIYDDSDGLILEARESLNGEKVHTLAKIEGIHLDTVTPALLTRGFFALRKQHKENKDYFLEHTSKEMP